MTDDEQRWGHTDGIKLVAKEFLFAVTPPGIGEACQRNKGGTVEISTVDGEVVLAEQTQPVAGGNPGEVVVSEAPAVWQAQGDENWDEISPVRLRCQSGNADCGVVGLNRGRVRPEESAGIGGGEWL